MRIIRKIRNFLRTSYVDNEVSRQLHSMSDRELADIGICRGDITRVASMRPGEFDRKNQV